MIEVRRRYATSPKPVARRDRELAPRRSSRGSKKVPLPVHLEVGDERVPVRDRAPAGPGVEVDAGEAEGRRDQRRGRLAVGPERLAVEEQLGVELAGPPARAAPCVRCASIVGRQTEQIDEGLQVGRERDDRADVQVAVRPAVEACADARGERVVDGRVAERALDADGRRRSPVASKKPLTPTTALSCSSASVVAGSSRSTSPLRRAAIAARAAAPRRRP